MVVRFSRRLMFLRGDGRGRPTLREMYSSHSSQIFCARAVSGLRYGWLQAGGQSGWSECAVRASRAQAQHMLRVPKDQHLQHRRQTDQDAERSQLDPHLGLRQVIVKLLVVVRLLPQRAHKLHNGAVDQRRLDLRRLLLPLGKGRAAVGAPAKGVSFANRSCPCASIQSVCVAVVCACVCVMCRVRCSGQRTRNESPGAASST